MCYKQSVQYYNEHWKLQDQTLYALCKENYSHDSIGDINAKLWIIGRTYATGIERSIGRNGNQGGALTQLAQHLHKKKKNVNCIFKNLKMLLSGNCDLDSDKLERIVELHGRLTNLIQEITNKKNTSFVSKYMHFHCPIVPIYDDKAKNELNNLFTLNNELRVFQNAEIMDDNYYRFALKFWAFYEEQREQNGNVKVKHLDAHLLRHVRQ